MNIQNETSEKLLKMADELEFEILRRLKENKKYNTANVNNFEKSLKSLKETRKIIKDNS